MLSYACFISYDKLSDCRNVTWEYGGRFIYFYLIYVPLVVVEMLTGIYVLIINNYARTLREFNG